MEPISTLAVSAPIAVILILFAVIVAIPVGVLAIVYLVVPFFKGIAWIIKQVGVFIFSTVADLMRLLGALITSLVLVPLTVGNVIVGRWSATAHYGRAIQAEFKNAGRCFYRLAIGNPARLLCLTPLTDGIERRIPQVMAAAPGPDRPSRRHGQFPGYEIVGSLPGGGSGGRLYVARPDAQKLASFARNNHTDVDRVVIKCFSTHEGTTLPQIVRENRALDAAKKLGLILEHEITNERFFYVMRYVPGDSLNLVTQRLHAAAGNSGLGRREIHEVLSYAADLLRTLSSYHAGGLWHKDVKPDNIIVSDRQAHLVDFGLVTPLRSSMTLTTHGTEYFRDPEMVRMALKGVKVHEVDGAKFDLYAVGAVLFSMIENSFPAHGGLSQITRPCPEAVRWIVRRAMTDYDKRYHSADAMLADVHAVLHANDPFALRPAHLPSVAAQPAPGETMPPAAPSSPPIPQPAYAGTPQPPASGDWNSYPGMNPGLAGAPGAAGVAGAVAAAAAAAASAAARIRPDIRVTGWWSGRYSADPTPQRAGVHAPGSHTPVPAASAAPPPIPSARRSPRVHPAARASAEDQRRHARERAAAARQRIHGRMHARAANFPAGINSGVVVAVVIFLGSCAFLAAILSGAFASRSRPIASVPVPPSPRVIVADVPGVPASPRLAPAPTVFASSAIPQDARALVLCEWSKFDEHRQEQIAAQIENLDSAGFLLLGDYVPAFQTVGAHDEEHAELVARLRGAVGTRLYLSTDARDAIRSWLDDQDLADVVIWFAGEPGRPAESATAWVVGSSRLDAGITKTAQKLLRSAR